MAYINININGRQQVPRLVGRITGYEKFTEIWDDIFIRMANGRLGKND